jgi:hypothetical protein
MLTRRLALTVMTTAALTAGGASVARADIGFLVMPGFSGVEIDGDAEAAKLELLRGGAVIASSDDGAVFVDALQPGDVARAYHGDGSPAGAVTYDGTPAISGACIGGTTFTATRGASALFQYAGAFTGSALEPLEGTWDSGPTARVTLSGPLTDGDIVFVSVGRDDVEPAYSSTRIEPAVSCSAEPGATPAPTAAPTPGGGSTPPGGRPAPGKLSLATTRAALAKAKLRAKLTLPVTLPEAGHLELRLTRKGHVLARGIRNGTGTVRVTLKLKQRLKRGTRVTLRATFTPSRAGAEPQRASVNVTLTGSSSRA